MTINLYDLSHTQRRLVQKMFDDAQAEFPEIATDFAIWLNPDDKEHILLNVQVPFFDNEREAEFSSFTAGLSADMHEESGLLISLMPRYVPTLHNAVSEHELQAA